MVPEELVEQAKTRHQLLEAKKDMVRTTINLRRCSQQAMRAREMGKWTSI